MQLLEASGRCKFLDDKMRFQLCESFGKKFLGVTNLSSAPTTDLILKLISQKPIISLRFDLFTFINCKIDNTNGK